MKTPFIYRRPIRWGDTDAARIVFTAHYFDICMEAIESFFHEILELDWFAMTCKQSTGTPFVHAEVDFHTPLTPRDVLNIRVDIEHQGNSSLSLILYGNREVEGVAAFTGRFTCSFSDLNNLKSIPIPSDIRQRITCYQQQSSKLISG
ncbi:MULTISPECIES: thioesterase family protein [Halomonadaceae]|uniref:Acyl-CoA thioesterase n=1 Tax=Vreelandella glaciei TaxID=186761 RepID=A0A7Z0LQ23_9GAMM|nr:thioesterase family protein [Halomonas sp. Alg239-R46]NYS76479.1 acyl-CoA thioesterase [Halomonas glaciei]